MTIAFIIIIGVLTVALIALAIITLKDKKAVKELIAYARQIAVKNVEVADIKSNGNKDIRALSEYINRIKSNLLAFIESTKGNVIVLSDAIDVLSKATKANEIGSEQTSDSICIVAEKAAEQLDLVRDNLELIEANNRQLEIIDDSINVVKEKLDETSSYCESGIKSLEQYESDMQLVEDNLQRSLDILKEFNDQIKKVNSIGELVIEVSEELKLLAFNASIESARAGEAGKGFSVVSQEMSVMSEKTKESMDAINDILGKVMESSLMVNDSINQCSNTFSSSSKIFGDVSSSFRIISDHSADVNIKMADMTKKYSVIAKNSDVSKEKAENVFNASGAISDSTRDIVAISEETTAESAQMTENVESLEKMLEGIRKLIKQFNTGVVPVDKNRDKKVKIAFISKLDNYFWYSVRRGVMYAIKELANNNVEIIYKGYVTDEEEAGFGKDILDFIEEGVEALIYPGFIVTGIPEIKKAVEQGMKVFTYNCDCSSDIKRISCYEPDQEEAGIMAANAIAKAINKKGNIAIVLGDKKAALNRIRYDSFVNRINTSYKEINIVATEEVTYNPEKTYHQVVNLIKNNPGICAIYSTTGMQVMLAKAIEDTGNVGKIKAVVFDQNDEIFSYIKKGIIAAAIDHDPFSQGHDPIILMYNHIVDGLELPAERVKCKANIVDEENIGERISVQ